MNGPTMRNQSSRAHRALLPLALLGLGLALTPVLASDWPELRGDTSRRGVSSEKITTPLSLLWRYSAGAQPLNSNGPTVVGNTAYFAARANSDRSSTGVLYAVDTKTGSLKWRYPEGSPGEGGLPGGHTFRTAPLVSDGRVYVGASDGSLYVLNANTGEYILQFRTARAVESAPSIVDGVLYFGSNDGTFYALDPKTGQPAWRQLYQAGSSINSAPIISAGYIFFTTVDNSLHAVKEKSGVRGWTTRLPYRILPNAPIFADNNLLVPAGPRLFAMQPTSGFTRWAMTLPGEILTAPTADNGIVYVICRDEKTTGSLIYGFRINNGRVALSEPISLPLTPAAPPTISGNVMFIPTNRNMLMAVSLEDGKILWEYYVEASSNRPVNPNSAPSNTSLTSPVSVSNGTIYCLGDDGSLMAFRPDAVDTTGPALSGLYPPIGSVVNGQPPVTIAAYAVDAGTGLNHYTIEMMLDDQKVQPQYDARRNMIYYQTRATGKIVDPPLNNGVHNIKLMVSDWRGNKTEQTWSFRVNNSLPKPALGEAPVAPKARPGIGANQPGNRPGGNQPGNPPGGRRGRGDGNRPGGANPGTPPSPPGRP